MSWSREKYHKCRDAAIEHYGGNPPKCACCGEKIRQFLALDHIKGGGNKHRKKIKSRYRTVGEYLVAKKFPKGYQVLCFNCNCAKGFYGKCPHEEINARI